MKTTHHRLPSATALLSFGLLVAACGNDKQLQAKTPAAPQAEALGRANAQPAIPLPNSSTSSIVAISEDVLRACNIPDGDAYFAFDSSQLTTFDHHPLDAVATCFTRGPMAGRKLDLVGHADPRGSSEYNVALGQSRADAVASYLGGRGMRSDRAAATSRGAMDATGRDETGWAHDRRVDVLLGR
jgi:peptidoglycan-associated lipoprotein